MALSLNSLKDKESVTLNVIFYSVFTLLLGIVFSYFLFAFKIYLQNQEINELDNIMSVIVPQYKINEVKVLAYKKKIDDYNMVINGHKISLNIFTFLEEKTLSNVWFSDFSMSQLGNEVKLTGETEDMETLSRQIGIFEKSKDYIKSVAVLQSTTQTSGRVQFTLNIYFTPQIFVGASI